LELGAPESNETCVKTIGVVGVTALLGKWATRVLFHAPTTDTPDGQHLTEWTATLA
jgi:hypothetical protein